MTGVAPASSGVYNNGQDWRKSPRLAKAVTIPEHFRASGYTAYGGGKIFHSLSWITKGYGKQQNEAAIWDHYWPTATNPMPDALWPTGTEAKRAADGYVHSKPLALGKLGDDGKPAKGRPPHFFDWAVVDGAESKMSDAQIVDWASAEFSKRRAKPFFHAVGIYRPHIPWYAPSKYFDLYPLDEVELPKIREDDLDDVPASAHRSLRKAWHRWILASGEWKAAVQGYLASISFADAQVGRLIAALDRSPQAKDTIVVLWSDHGMHIGEKQQWEKFTLFEESTRVPFLIVAPGVSKKGGVCERPVNLLDIYPTLNELCGLPKRDDLDGVSLVPLLRHPKAKWERASITTWGRDNHAARGNRYRYVRWANGEEELYDHEKDPDEFVNLADEPELESVKKRLRAWMPKKSAERVR